MGKTIDSLRYIFYWKSHRYRWLFFTFLLLATLGCHTDPHTRLVVRIQSGHGKKMILSSVPYLKEKARIIDSATVEDMTRDIIFDIPGEEHLYQLSFRQSGVKFLLINDTRDLSLSGNFLTGKYQVQNSAASAGLHRFMEEQAGLAARTRALAQLMRNDSTDSLRRALDSCLAALAARYRDFADTVTSPSAFMAVADLIDFGKDYSGQTRFINAAAARFPSSSAIRDLREDILGYIRVMQEEFQPGDRLPPITLPDSGGRLFTTASLKGKYYLIDFWSTWCPQCAPYHKIEAALRRAFPPEKFAIVSVAIDAEREDWKNYLRHQRPDWPQLIDTEMWQGAAVRTLKFDSIPFNFLVNPEGCILRKGLRPDSLAIAVGSALTP